MIYQWKPGAHAPTTLDAQTVGDHLEALREQAGHLTPDVIVEDAERLDSPIHDAFEWDDTEAAHQYRLTQARQLVRVIIREPEAPGEPRARAFISINDGLERRYEPVDVVLRDPAMRSETLYRALRELNQLRRKYADLQELSELWAQLENVAAAA